MEVALQSRLIEDELCKQQRVTGNTFDDRVDFNDVCNNAMVYTSF